MCAICEWQQRFDRMGPSRVQTMSPGKLCQLVESAPPGAPDAWWLAGVAAMRLGRIIPPGGGCARAMTQHQAAAMRQAMTYLSGVPASDDDGEAAELALDAAFAGVGGEGDRPIVDWIDGLIDGWHMTAMYSGECG